DNGSERRREQHRLGGHAPPSNDAALVVSCAARPATEPSERGEIHGEHAVPEPARDPGMSELVHREHYKDRQPGDRDQAEVGEDQQPKRERPVEANGRPPPAPHAKVSSIENALAKHVEPAVRQKLATPAGSASPREVRRGSRKSIRWWIAATCDMLR